MARRLLLSNDLWARHLEPPADECEIARHYALGTDELAEVAARRGDANTHCYSNFPPHVADGSSETKPSRRRLRINHYPRFTRIRAGCSECL